MPDIKQTPEEKTKALYDATSKDYDVGTYDEFKTKLQDPTKRQAFYKTASQDYDLGNFDDFETKLGFKKKVSTSPLAPLPEEKPQMFGIGSQDQFTPQSNVVPTAEDLQKNKLADAGTSVFNTEKNQELQHQAELKKQDTGQDRVSNFMGHVDQALANLPADLLQGGAVLMHPINKGLNALTGTEPPSIQESGLYKMGEWYKNATKELFPTNPAFQENLDSKVGEALGNLTSLAMSGGMSAETKALAEFTKASNMFVGGAKIAGKTLATPPSLIGATQMGVSEFNAAKQAGADDDTAFDSFLKNAAAGSILEALPIMKFWKRLDQTTGGGVKNLIKNGTVQGFEEGTTEIAQQVFSNVSAGQSYDATRKWYDGMMESGGIGFGLGFLLGGMGTSLRKKQSEATTPEEKAQIQKAIDFVDHKSEELTLKTEATNVSPEVTELTSKKEQLASDIAKPDVPESVKVALQEQYDNVNSQLSEKIQSEKQTAGEAIANNQAVQNLSSQQQEIESQLQREDLSPETKTVLENQKTEIDSQLKQLTKNEKAVEATEEAGKEKPEVAAVQEGQKLEEKLVDDAKAVKTDKKIDNQKKAAALKEKKAILSRERRSPMAMARGWILDGGKLRGEQSPENKLAGNGIGKGIKEELGVGSHEIGKFIGVIDNKNGLGLEEAAHQIWNNLDESLQEKYDTTEIRNALNDVLLSEDRKDWVQNQHKDTQDEVDGENEWMYSQLSDEEKAGYDDFEKSDSYQEEFNKNKAELEKGYLNQQANDTRRESSPDDQKQETQRDSEQTTTKRKTADVIRENGNAPEGQKSTVQEIKSKNLTHVSGLGMGQNQVKGTYVSTEAENRYKGRGGKEHTAEVDINTPFTTNHDAFGEIQRVAIAEHFPGKETIEDLSETEIDQLAGILTDTFKAEGYDSVYFPESDTQEGELIVFDKDKVKLTEVPPTPPIEKNTETEAKEPEKKERSFPKQITEEEVKGGLSEEAKTYIPITNKITNEEANKFIQDKGMDQALEDVRDTKNDMKAPVRVALAENIIKQSNKAANEATNQEDKNKHLDRAIKSADFISQYLTELGQGVQAASMYAKLSPEGVLRYVRREYDKTRRKAISEVSDELKDNKEVIDKINKEAIEKVLGTDKVKKAIEGKVKNASESRKKSVKKATDFLESLKINTKGKAGDICYLLHASAWIGAFETIQKSLELGLSVVESIDAAVKYVKGVHKEEWDEVGFRKKFSGDLSKYEAAIDPAGSTKKGIADLGINIQEIIKEHYSKVDTAKKTLVQKILDNTDLTEIDAKEIAKNIEEEFDRITTAEKKRALIKFLSPKSIIPSKKPQFYEDIIKMSNVGALSEADWHKLYAHKMNLPSLSEADAKKLMDLADKVQTAKEGFQKNRATQDLLAFQEKLKGISWGEVGSAIWYANILSGLSTQTTNAYSGFMEVMGELWVSSVQDPKNFPFLIKNLYEGWGRGRLEAASVLKSGYQPEKGSKIESPASLERIKFSGGNWNPVNYAKYVSRLMSAVDIFHYHALKEMRAGELAMKMAVVEGKDQPTQAIKTRAIEILNKTKEREVQARSQALEEGLKGQELDRRIFELMEQSRPHEITEDAADFAAHGTFNYEPEGLLGAITAGFNYVSSISEIKGVRPLQFIVPFTRVIANVTNRSLDWTPWGLVRGAKGQIGYENKLTKDRYVKKYTPEERQREYIKAVTGTLAMAALWAMTDDEDGLFEITADGTGDRKKNYELQGSGWRPYSIRIGDTWFNYQNTPLSIAFAMIGFSRDAIKYKGEKDIEAKVSITMLGGSKYIMDMNFLSNLAGFFSIFSKDNPDADASFTQRAAKEFGRTAKGFVIPNLFTQVSRSIQEIYDLPMKRANGIIEEFTRDIPVLRDNQENMYNSLGDPIIADQTRKFVPFKPKNDEDNRVYDLIIANQAWIGLPNKQTEFYDKKMKSERTFTDTEYSEFARLSGQYTKKAIQDQYNDLRKNDSREEVRKSIENLKRTARAKAKWEMAKNISK